MLALPTLIFHLDIPKHYTTYTHFTASLSNTVFTVLYIPYNNRIHLKTTEEKTKMLVGEEVIGPSCSPKRTVSCFSKGKPFYILTLIHGSTIPYGTQSVGQLVTWFSLCSCRSLPICAGTTSTCWVFAVNYIVLIPKLMFESIIY